MVRTKSIRSVITAGLLCAMVPMNAACAQSEPTAAVQAETAMRDIQREIAIAGILDRLMPDERAFYTVVRDVRIVDPANETVSNAQSIVIRSGEIRWIGPQAAEPVLDDLLVIDGRGRYLSPGLIDMHIHSESASSWLLNLANGVTSVRELSGFPWMLATRRQINAGRMLGPNLYVAGPIFNQYPLGGYAVIPVDSVEARSMVRRQAACGYDFVKVHNVVSPQLLAAIGDEAERAGLGLVGHVPHFIGVRDAIDAGLRVQEHLKGFLDDRTLTIGDADYAAASLPDVWITPTLYTGQAYLPVEQMQAALVAEETRYVPPETLDQWRAVLAEPEDQLMALRRNSQRLRREIVASLAAYEARFLAGTDASNYPFQIMGFALIEEMRLLQNAGVPIGSALRAATTMPADAMDASGEFGRIAPGHRADLVLLDNNPLDDLQAYRSNHGVMVRGIWLTPAALDTALDEIAALYSDTGGDQNADHVAILATVERLMENGFVFPQHVIDRTAAAFQLAGANELAYRLQIRAGRPLQGPCAEILQ